MCVDDVSCPGMAVDNRSNIEHTAVYEGHTIQMTTILEKMRIMEDELSSIQTLVRGPLSFSCFLSLLYIFLSIFLLISLSFLFSLSCASSLLSFLACSSYSPFRVRCNFSMSLLSAWSLKRERETR